MKVVELFSGIGSQAKALERVAKKHNMDIDITKTCEWNVHAFVAYHLIHNTQGKSLEVSKLDKDQILAILDGYSLSLDGIKPINRNYLKSLDQELLRLIYSSILNNSNMLDVKNVKGSDIPNDTTLLTYSFPCQDLSNVGSFHGYKSGIDRNQNSRSGLLWEVERILEEKLNNGESLPKFLLLENVTTLVAERHKYNFAEWKEKLEEMGYMNQVYFLNSLDFGIPQYRRRLLMLSVFVGDDISLKDTVTSFFKNNDLNDLEYINKLRIKRKNLDYFLKIDYTRDSYFIEACEAQPNNTSSREKIWNSNLKIINEDGKVANKVQTITTKQDRHPNSGNIYFDYNEGKAKYRFLTPRECFMLMGFDEKDFEILKIHNHITRKDSLFFSRDILYKLAGNSIVVNVLEQLFEQIIKIQELIKSIE